MGRKETSNELLAMRALEEQRWAYERKLEHMSIREMRALVQRSPGEGGLGYDISEHGLRKLVTAYMGRMADVEADSVDFHRQRELADMDARQRAHNVMVDPINRAKLRLVADRLGITPDEVIAEHPDLVPWRDEKVILNALAGLEKVAAERRKLLGLDAPSQVHVAVTTHDAVTDELNDMLARAGRKTIEVG